jgi:uncharacterized protein (UPF0305 family)
MKIQLVKEITDLGEVRYFVNKDNRYVPNTITPYFEEAVESYNKVVAHSKAPVEILMEVEIDY